MIYGAAVFLITPRVLSKEQLGVWAIFQTIFMVISLLSEFFILQPMVKISSEHLSDDRPVFTASILLYTLIAVGLGYIVTLGASQFAAIFKTPAGETAFAAMGMLMLSTLVRNIAIRILQVDYRIIGIFLIDLAYFAIVVGLMIRGKLDGSFDTALDFVDYNLVGFTVSSLVGLALAARRMAPTTHGILPAARRILKLGLHQGGTGILTVAQQQSDVMIVGGMKGEAAVGIYFIARTFYRFFDAIRDAAQLLLVPATSRAFSQERIEAVEEVTEVATALLVALTAPISLGAIIAAPLLSPYIPAPYNSAIDEFQWLMAGGFVMPFVIVPSAVLLGIGHTRDLFRGTLVGTLVLVFGGLILTWFWGAAGMAAGVFCGTVVTAILLTRRMNRYVPFTFRSVLKRSRSFGPIVRRRILRRSG
jgi:O-antigen/teichoic acid export membrane protein